MCWSEIQGLSTQMNKEHKRNMNGSVSLFIKTWSDAGDDETHVWSIWQGWKCQLYCFCQQGMNISLSLSLSNNNNNSSTTIVLIYINSFFWWLFNISLSLTLSLSLSISNNNSTTIVIIIHKLFFPFINRLLQNVE